MKTQTQAPVFVCSADDRRQLEVTLSSTEPLVHNQLSFRCSKGVSQNGSNCSNGSYQSTKATRTNTKVAERNGNSRRPIPEVAVVVVPWRKIDGKGHAYTNPPPESRCLMVRYVRQFSFRSRSSDIRYAGCTCARSGLSGIPS